MTDLGSGRDFHVGLDVDELSQGRVEREPVHAGTVERQHQLRRGPVHAVPGNLATNKQQTTQIVRDERFLLLLC